MMNKKHYILILLLFLTIVQIKPVKAQLNPLSSHYYNNGYLVNPSLAGKDKGFTLQGTYRELWSEIIGSPVTQNVTAEYGFNRVGLGLNINNESAGLLQQTRAMMSYAYHLPIYSEENQLHFGVSLGFMNQRLENNDIHADPNDIAVIAYNGRQTYVDGDFGISYTSNRLNIQAAIPNLKFFFNKGMANIADRVTFYSAASYRFDINQDIDLEPKLVFRGVNNYKNMVDLGMQLSFAEQKITAMGIYHNNRSATMGAGIKLLNKYTISGMYTTEVGALSSYVNGSFEFNIKLHLKK